MIWFSLIFHTPPAFFHISQCSRFGEKRMWSLTENWTRSWCACAFAKSNRHPRHRTQVELRLAGPSSLRWLWNSACASVLRKSRSMSFSLCWASDRPEQKDGADTTVPSKLALQKHRIQHTIEFNCSRSHLTCIMYMYANSFKQHAYLRHCHIFPVPSCGCRRCIQLYPGSLPWQICRDYWVLSM